eukprot:11503019-Ditylum_brightwellii.AAC.1
MMHPCNCTLVGVDDNNIGSLTPYSNSAGIDGTMLFHGVDNSGDSGKNGAKCVLSKCDDKQKCVVWQC